MWPFLQNWLELFAYQYSTKFTKFLELIFSGWDTDNQKQLYFLQELLPKNYIFQNHYFESMVLQKIKLKKFDKIYESNWTADEIVQNFWSVEGCPMETISIKWVKHFIKKIEQCWWPGYFVKKSYLAISVVAPGYHKSSILWYPGATIEYVNPHWLTY